MKSPFLIVADRGNLKAYRVEPQPGGRAPRLALVESLTMTDAHTKISERNTDLAGSFPVGSAPAAGGRHQNAIAEKHLDLEIDKRLIKQIAGHIDTILDKEQPRSWSFAAPSTINRAILDEIAGNHQRAMVQSVAADLVNLAPTELPEHFPAFQE